MEIASTRALPNELDALISVLSEMPESTLELDILREKTGMEALRILELLKLLESNRIISFLATDGSEGKTEIRLQPSYLDFFNLRLHERTVRIRDEMVRKRVERGYVARERYCLNELQTSLYAALGNIEGLPLEGSDAIEISFIDQAKFTGDIAVKIPSLISSQKIRGKSYIKDDIPLISEAILTDIGLTEKIELVEAKGIYLNITFKPGVFSDILSQVADRAHAYGEWDAHARESILIDYSSPNTGKPLHAGHIRSTIIGHVLSHIYAANGYTVHRVNHINDWGGFGVYLEGLERWKELLPEASDNGTLSKIYSIFRLGERASASEEDFGKLEDFDRTELARYYGEFSDFAGFAAAFGIFKQASQESFRRLEAGQKDEVVLWEKIVHWSMDDFAKFYEVLGICQEHTIGESFYSNMGKRLVKDLSRSGDILLYTEELAERDKQALARSLEAQKISQPAFDIAIREIEADVGAYLVRLSVTDRFVVLKWDESTIYATRDLAAIMYRTQTFNPSRIVYEVGQEQAEHFDKLFRSAAQLGKEDVGLSHVYHGFYVDAETGKKLSSRAGAANVMNLITSSVAYFRKKYDAQDGKNDLSVDEIDDAAKKLGVWSIIFNDLMKDKKLPVRVHEDTEKMCQEFERSGGAYVMYIVCRAKKIVTDSGIDLSMVNLTQINNFTDKEKAILLKLMSYPKTVALAWDQDDPSRITEFLLQLSRLFSSYYQDKDERIFEKNSFQVIPGREYKLAVYQAVAQVLTNAANLCHITIPNKI